MYIYKYMFYRHSMSFRLIKLHKNKKKRHGNDLCNL